jgi:methionyl-tRNA formyltransferase
MSLGLLCSGRLGYQTLLKLLEKYQINFVFTDSKSKNIIQFCEQNKLRVFVGNPRNGRAKEFIAKNECEILISINYLFLIEEDIINLSKGLTFNIHGSLLPKYRGRTPHVWAIINGEEFTGITAHIIDEGCDSGDILEQIKISIEPNDTGDNILTKYESNYLPLIEKVIDSFNQGKLKPKKQDPKKATYYGKRIPDDGLINWNWQKERIYNWIRAQAHPYPGAFTFLHGKKITIDEISYSDDGYEYKQPNGMVLNSHPLIIKTPNGAVEIKSFREKIELTKGQVLI